VSTPIAHGDVERQPPVFRRKCSGVDVDVISIYNFSHSHPRNSPLKAVEYATEIDNLVFLRGVYPLESVGYGREPKVIWKGLVKIFRMSYLHPPSDYPLRNGCPPILWHASDERGFRVSPLAVLHHAQLATIK
jgi:hypothetical protein